jgi:hypothetical protein
MDEREAVTGLITTDTTDADLMRALSRNFNICTQNIGQSTVLLKKTTKGAMGGNE